MSIEILSVSLSEESVEKLADAVTARLAARYGYPSAATQSEPPSPNFSQSAEPSGFQQQPDPWQNGTAPQQQPYQPTPSSQIQPQYQGAPQQSQLTPTAQVMTGYQGPPPAVQQGPPDRYCTHGKMRLVPAGTYQSGPRTGQPRAAFYGCSLQRGDPNQCKPVNV